MNRLQTSVCKRANGLYKPVTQFLKWLARFQLYKAKCSRLETRLDQAWARMAWSCLETRLNDSKQWLRSWLSGLQAAQMA